MDIDYQVARVENQIKPKDLGGLGIELKDRKGTGNYDLSRTQFNIEYVGFDGYPTLSSKIYQTLYTNDIHFNKSDKTNILNGCIITSGPDFFRKLGLPMKDTGRVYVEGKHIGEPIFCPDIKSKEDIPEKVLEFFNESYEFMSNYVGKENVIYAGVHFDEDTPHMQFYWIPVVDQVKRKVFETDSNGKRITKQIYTKDNIVKNVPIQKKDEKGKPIFEIEYGKFLNADEFWKQKGGKTSYAKLQDNYHDYIVSKGFDLDRGQIGSNAHHQDKAEQNYKQLLYKNEQLQKEIDTNSKLNEIELKTNKELLNLDSDEIFYPSKDIFKKYKDKDVERLVDYSKEIKKANIKVQNESNKKEVKINNLEKQIDQFKSGKTYSDKESIIRSQKKTIDEQSKTIEEKESLIEELNNTISELREKLSRAFNTAHKLLTNAYLAVAHLLGFKNVTKENINPELMASKVEQINHKYETKKQKDNSDDFEL